MTLRWALEVKGLLPNLDREKLTRDIQEELQESYFELEDERVSLSPAVGEVIEE